MKRLREEGPLSEPGEAIRLLRAVRPLEPSSALRQRVRAEVSTRAAPVYPGFLFRPAVAALVIVASVVMASAMVVRWRHRGREAAAVEHAGSLERLGTRTPAGTDAPSASAAAPADAESLSAPRPSSTAVHRSKPHATGVPLPAESAAPSSSLAPPIDISPARMASAELHEASLLVAGLKALRQARDPARASALFAEYLRSYPHGAFAEEVLALSMEAAASQGGDAHQFAADYLARYPLGRFRSLAVRASGH